MNLDEILDAQMEQTLDETHFDTLGSLYRGKVRDVYKTDDRLVIITTDRVSAFDVVLGTIPFKGEILNAMAADAFERTKDIAPNHIIGLPDPNVIVAKVCHPYPVELIVRGYITGSLWRDYQSGKASQYEIELPTNLRKDQQFSSLILTPSTKAEKGEHDEPISKKKIIERGLMTKDELEEAEETAFLLFQRGTERAAERGLILVDTKYEIGKDSDGNLTIIDEIHTPDSSRYWIADQYESRFAKGESQAMLDKENLRGWLIEEHNFTGHGPAPELTENIRKTLSKRYLEAHELMIGKPFEPHPGDARTRIADNLRKAGLLP